MRTQRETDLEDKIERLTAEVKKHRAAIQSILNEVARVAGIYALEKIVKVAEVAASGRQMPAFHIERSHEAVDAFWKVWMEVGEPHKHGVYESTWMSFKAAMKAGGKDQRTDLAMSEMIEKASDAIRQTACPKCSQRGLIECEHISPADLAKKIDAVDGRESS